MSSTPVKDKSVIMKNLFDTERTIIQQKLSGDSFVTPLQHRMNLIAWKKKSMMA